MYIHLLSTWRYFAMHQLFRPQVLQLSEVNHADSSETKHKSVSFSFVLLCPFKMLRILVLLSFLSFCGYQQCFPFPILPLSIDIHSSYYGGVATSSDPKSYKFTTPSSSLCYYTTPKLCLSARPLPPTSEALSLAQTGPSWVHWYDVVFNQKLWWRTCPSFLTPLLSLFSVFRRGVMSSKLISLDQL